MSKKRHPVDIEKAMQPAARTSTRAPDPAVAPLAPLKGRTHKFNITGYFSAGVKARVKVLCAVQNLTVQQLLADALRDYFTKHGGVDVGSAPPLEW